MSNIRDLNTKINSLKNMQKVMSAMNMIASIKLRKLYAVQETLSLFSKSVDDMCKLTFYGLKQQPSLLTTGYDDVKMAHIIMFTADKGLCGTHNSSVQKAVTDLIQENNSAGITTDLTCIGNKGAHYCNRKEYKIFQQTEIGEKVFTPGQLNALSRKIVERFKNGDIQKLYVVSNVFHSTLRQETVTLQLLPVFLSEKDLGESTEGGISTEPDKTEFANSFIDLYVLYKLKSLLLHSYLSEHASRMTAMENATNNSEDLINKYRTMQNHARQAAITNELIEIVSGKEALKG